jgi:5-methylthioadenosine/S-adenosylhomocysteine deaminase
LIIQSDRPCIVLENGLILTDASLSVPEPHQRTVISADKIIDVNSTAPTPRGIAETIDCSNCIIIPGLVNCHVHSPMSLFRGLADDLPLQTWLERFIFPSEALHVTPEMVRLGATLSAVEMALSGITTYADAYFFMEQAALAAIDIGLRAIIAQGVLDVPTPDVKRAGCWRDRVSEFFENVPSHATITPSIFCHSPYLCGSDTFKDAWELSKSAGVKLFSHVSETTNEIEQVTLRHGVSPIQMLDSINVLDRDFVAIHCVHLTPKDLQIIGERSVNIVHCPESNMKLASGSAPVANFLQLQIGLGIGTDSPASNNNLDLFEEMRSAALMAKLTSNNPEAVSARNALSMATIGGARCLGLDKDIGTLEIGKQADIVVVDLDKPHLFPLYDPISQLVYCANAGDVRDVIVAGRLIVRNRRLSFTGYNDVRERCLELARKIAESSKKSLFLA